MKVVVTIPAYNEAKTIGKVISDIKEVMGKTKYSYKLLVVNDGSKDNTAEIAKNKGATIINHPTNYGLAETFKTEIEKSLAMEADVIVHIDADGQYSAKEIPLLIKEIESGCDLVLGSRFKGKIEQMSQIKRWGNKAFSKVISNICRIKITDGQTGFRAFTKKVAGDIKIISTHTYTQEQIIKAAKHKFRIKEVPITFNRRIGSKSRLMKGPIDYAIKAWLNILRIYRDYEPMKFFGSIGGFFIILGTLIGVWIVYNILKTGAAGGTPRVILSSLLLIAGIQIIVFGFLADMNKK